MPGRETKVINLAQFRAGRAFGGIVFPKVYRVIGRYFDWTDLSQTRAYETDRPLPPVYRLRPEGAPDRTEDVTEIDRLDPKIDSGWLIIRHLRNQDQVNGWLWGSSDFADTAKESGEPCVFLTEHGLFCVDHRPASTGLRDHLLIYEWNEEDLCRVIDCDGQVHGEEVLFPPDD